MPLLSLGLNNNEREGTALSSADKGPASDVRDDSLANHRASNTREEEHASGTAPSQTAKPGRSGSPENRADKAKPLGLWDDSRANHPTSIKEEEDHYGTAGSRALPVKAELHSAGEPIPSGENGNGRGPRAGAPVSSQTHTAPDPSESPALPPSVEKLRSKLAEEEKRRMAKIGPAPLAASVTSLSSSERQWVPTFSTFKFGYLPGRGLLFSTIGHEVVIFGLFFLFTYALPRIHPQRLIPNNPQDHIIYLPEVGGGSEGEKSPGAGESAPQQPAAAPARASKGFAYPGRQAILSNPPNPTNAFQTIQRPLLVHPEQIHKLIPLPNIVQMAETRLPSDLLAAKAAMPQLKEAPKAIRVKQDAATHREAKFKVPVNDAPKLVAKAEMPKLPAAEEPLPEAPKVLPQPKLEVPKTEAEKPAPQPVKVTAEKRAEKAEKEVAPPSTAQIARMEMHGKAKEPLLSLSPMPLPNGPDAKFPNGEARGKFAIAPGGTLNPNSLAPGKPNATPSTTPGTGQETAKAPNEAGTEVASNAGVLSGHGGAAAGGKGHADVATGSGTTAAGGGSGNSSSSGNGTGGPGVGKGHGASGKGAGATGGHNGSGNGSGAGAGSGSGTGSFPGITIQGGENADAKNTNPPAFTIEPQTAYNMTVVSTASSGGGLEDFGVFNNERIFTVYIPVKPSPELADPTWTLQYALLDDHGASDIPLQQIIPPSAVSREWPQLPPALEKKYAHRQVVIYAIVDKDGKVTHLSVKRTPDPRVSDPIAQALQKWTFHPAQVNNQPVAVKILLGIPLS